MDTIAVSLGALSAVFFAFGTKSLRNSVEKRKELEEIRNKRVYTPDEIKQIIEKNEQLSQTLFTAPSKDQQNSLLGKKILLQGEIQNTNCLQTLLPSAKKAELILRLNYEIPYYTNKEAYKILSQKRMEQHYYMMQYLSDAANRNIKVLPQINIEKNGVACSANITGLVTKSMNKIDRNCFDYQTSSMEVLDLSIWKRIWNPIGLGFAFFGKLFTEKDLRSLFCFKVKVDNCEIGIKNSGFITLFGDVIYDQTSRTMSIQNLTRIMKNKVELLDELRKNITISDVKSFLFIVGSGISIGLAVSMLCESLRHGRQLRIFGMRVQVPQRIARIFWWLNARADRKRLQGVQKAEFKSVKNSIEEVYTKPREAMACVICYEKCRSVIIRPCLHCIMCQDCYRHINKHECPICKIEILSEVPIQVDQKASNS